ncbi:MAG: 4Fe-4S cluster-binding domain-containing protein [Candidatus Saganbacteria bacterium]|nr:4Fe-4S cluster-binding domain-containing protein [Candidatus Saganbacteria bacterium]
MAQRSEWAGYDLDFLISYNIDDVVEKIRAEELLVAIFGAGITGRYALAALKSRGIHVSYVCDSDEQKQKKNFCGYEITSLSNLAKEKPNACVFICSTYLGPMLSALESFGFRNVFSCIPLFESTDFSRLEVNKGGLPIIKDFLKQDSGTAGIDRDLTLYKLELMQFVDKHRPDVLKLPVIDVVITEACTLRCKDCSNLMQYYARTKQVDLAILFESIEKIMKSVDRVHELRVMGGEPLINKEMYKVINKLLKYDNAGKIVVYTNATIVPQGQNLSCLKHKKVLFNITNYGPLSKNYDKLIGVLDNEGISYASKVVKFTDSGRILPYQNRTEKQLKDIFFNCCTNDVFTLLHGKLYHCPFSANATNLNAVPCDKSDMIELAEEKEGPQLRQKIEQFYKRKNYLTACSYCNGRDYRTPIIEPAIQTKKPLPLPGDHRPGDFN